MDAVAGIFAGVVTIIVALLKWQEARKNDAYAQAQKLREAVVDGDVVTINNHIDRVLHEASGSPTVISNADTAERLSKILGKGVVSK